MSLSVCRWGILGTANIARKNWEAIHNSGNATLVAVASRSPERARQFIRECQVQVPFPTEPRGCTYEELLQAPDVDAIYLPLPTGIRQEWAVRAADAGKHVVVEKPVGCHAGEVRAIIDACQRNKVQFMDGVMFMHSRRLDRLREALSDPSTVGEVKRIASQFSFRAPEEFLRSNIRVSSALEPLGCLGDLGWYNIRLTLWVMNYQLPVAVSGRILNETRPGSGPGVPLEFSAELFFDGGVTASFYCSFVTENQQWANISGSQGYILVSDFVLPHFGSEAAFTIHNATFSAHGCRFNMEEHTRRVAVHEYSNNAHNSQETNLFRAFAGLVCSGQRDAHWADMALKTQLVMDACLKSARADGQRVTCEG